MFLKIIIDSNSDAFVDFGTIECTRILKSLSDKMLTSATESDHIPLKDINGNTVGYASWVK